MWANGPHYGQSYRHAAHARSHSSPSVDAEKPHVRSSPHHLQTCASTYTYASAYSSHAHADTRTHTVRD